jgi:hypothetical protein
MRNYQRITRLGGILALSTVAVSSLLAAPRVSSEKIKIGDIKATPVVRMIAPTILAPQAGQKVSFPFTVSGKGKPGSDVLVQLYSEKMIKPKDKSGDQRIGLHLVRVDAQRNWSVVFDENSNHWIGPLIKHRILIAQGSGKDNLERFDKAEIPIVLVEPVKRPVPRDFSKRTKGRKVPTSPVGPGPHLNTNRR